MSTAQGIERRDFLGAPPSIDLLKRTVEYVASTEKLDSHGTIVRQKWQLDKYKKNPIFLYMHDVDDPIGSANVRVENDRLIATVKYAENDECAEKCLNLVKQGVARCQRRVPSAQADLYREPGRQHDAGLRRERARRTVSSVDRVQRRRARTWPSAPDCRPTYHAGRCRLAQGGQYVR